MCFSCICCHAWCQQRSEERSDLELGYDDYELPCMSGNQTQAVYKKSKCGKCSHLLSHLFGLVCVFFETGSYCIISPGLKLMVILIPQSLKGCYYRHEDHTWFQLGTVTHTFNTNTGGAEAGRLHEFEATLVYISRSSRAT